MIRHLLIILFISLTFKNFAQNTKDILSKIPQSDRDALVSIFYRMMHADNLSYTLFGDKPISLSGDFNLTPYGNILWAKFQCGGVFWKNWEIWEKHQNDFLIKNYLFIKEPSINSSDVTNIIFINKRQFIKIVDKHLDIFKDRLRRNLTGKSLLHEVEEKRKFASIIHNDEVLWGVLLGYGLHNAQLYNERLKLEKFINIEELPKIPEKKPSPRKNFTSIEEEYNFLNSQLEFFGEQTYSPLIASPIHFVADSSHPETKDLEKKYKALRERISAIYAKGDFLEITLSALTSEDSNSFANEI